PVATPQLPVQPVPTPTTPQVPKPEKTRCELCGGYYHGDRHTCWQRHQRAKCWRCGETIEVVTRNSVTQRGQVVTSTKPEPNAQRLLKILQDITKLRDAVATFPPSAAKTPAHKRTTASATAVTTEPFRTTSPQAQ